MLENIPVWLLCIALLASPSLRAADDVPAAPAIAKITLEAALQRALSNAPQLKAAQAAASAAKGSQIQAGVWPNPEIGVDAENVGAQGDYSGFKSAEITYGVSQLVEVSGKRGARLAAADEEHAIAHAELEAARLDLTRDVKTAYAEAVAAKEGVALAEKQRSLASEVLANVNKRVNAAAEPLFQRSKSQVALSTSEMALDKATRDYAIAKHRLASLWGAEAVDFDLDSTSFFTISAPPKAQAVPALNKPADLVRWDAEVARKEALYDYEQAAAIPDPRFNVGMKEFRATNDRAFVVGVSLPIPVFDMNGGNIARARSEVTKATSEKRLAEVSRQTELERNQQELESAYRQAQILQSQMIPAAEKAYQLSRQGYGAGKFAYLEVLDAQRTLSDVRAQFNEALKTYHIRSAQVERLTATYQPDADQKEDEHAN
ncbi:MAG: TolC family protein [Hyphomicrobiales bacterium]|nr:MAG: TolC family protein [Hyphomicrobiales bacterium]